MFGRFEGVGFGVQTIGRFTGSVKVLGESNLGTTLPYYDQFTLGGLFNLSGLPRNELLGQTSLFGALILQYRLNKVSGAIVRGLYLGASAEAGNVWQNPADLSLSHMKNAGSFFIAADTLIGPLYIAYGRASGGQHSFYFYLNRPF